ncbi:hypothetical protein HPB50_027276 [Hyalomma asiaticum]|uniref:Uncharacterized protein n=1 Tax=Hyalomma asiaticum TaxID=266040 RepID=A0ACB7TS04_HYAAI|nr:hypothetical protein HPB50_027276 [Hyalomma asiaticum]
MAVGRDNPLAPSPSTYITDGGSISRSNTVKVLVIIIGAYRNDNAEALKCIEKSILNFSRIISRVASRREGLLEDNLMKVFPGFHITHVIYAAPFLNRKKTKLNKIDTLIRTGFKTSTERLLQLSLHNTATKLFEAHRNAHISRLSLSRAGTEILLEAGIQHLFMPPEKLQLFTNAKKAITVDPISRNTHPTHNEGWRKARAKVALDKAKCNETKYLFVDAARYWNRGAYAVSIGGIPWLPRQRSHGSYQLHPRSRRNGDRSGPSKLHGSLSFTRTQNRHTNFFGSAPLFEGTYGCQETLVPRKGKRKFSVLTHHMVLTSGHANWCEKSLSTPAVRPFASTQPGGTSTTKTRSCHTTNSLLTIG